MGRLLRHFLLAGDCAARALLRAGIGMRSLTTNRKTAAVPDTAIRSDVHKSLHVHRCLGAKRTFNTIPALDLLAQAIDIGVAQIADARLRIDSGGLKNPSRRSAPDSKNVCEPDLYLLVSREIDACNTCHVAALTLLVLGIAAADDSCHAVPLDHLAVLTNRLDAAADFHGRAPDISNRE